MNRDTELARFAAGLSAEQIPDRVRRRTEDLMLDWLGSALAGKDAAPVACLARFARTMGPDTGPSELLTERRGSSALFAAQVNAAASHLVEQDDLHNGSVLHPGCVVFPAVLALAQARGATGRDLITAAVAGYEVGVRVGEFLGRSHYRHFHTTGTAGTLAAAAAAGRLLGLDAGQMRHCLGTAGTQAAGLWEFLRDAADSKQLHVAKAAGNGVVAACLAAEGFTGAARIFEGEQGMGAAMSDAPHPAALTDGLGQRWATAETSFKFHASCRHTHPAADALLAVMSGEKIDADQIRRVTARVHQGAIDVLGSVDTPQSVHQAKFSMGTVLALIALRGQAGVEDFETCLDDPAVAAFRDKVIMRLDPEVDAAYPSHWLGRITVELADGRSVEGAVDEPLGDPGNALSRDALEQKFRALAAFRQGATPAEADALIDRIWHLDTPAPVGRLLAS